MDNINKCLASSTSIKPSSDVGGNTSDNENELNPEIASKLKSPRNKQLPTKNFMNPTISATFKVSVPKKKILGERNETVEQTSLQRSYSFGSKPVKSPVVDDDGEKDLVGGKQCLQPYDPVKNYLSPRPKFLRYDPDRRRKILNLQENDEDRVKISTYFQAGNDVPVAVPNSSGLKDSCSEQESVEDVNVDEGEEESGEECGSEDDEEMVEIGEDGCCSVKGFFKFVFVVIAVILTTQAICSMNSPYPLQSLDPVWGFNHSVNHVCGLKLSKVGYGPIREPDVLVERLKEGDGYGGQVDVSETNEEYVEVQFAKTDEILEEEVKASEVVETDYVEAETVNDFNQDGVKEDDSDAIEKNHQLTSGGILLEDEIKASEVVVAGDVEAETVDNFSQDDSDAYEKNDQLTNDIEFETANDMEDGVEKELDDVKTNDVLIKVTSFNLTIAILIGHVLVLTSFGAIYRSRCKKVEKEAKDLEPLTNPHSMTEEHVVTNAASLLIPPQQNDVTKEISHAHIPSVELLGEFVFGEETTSNMSPEIQTTAVSSSLIETSHRVKKQRCKNAEVVTPSSVSVRRSSRLKTRSSVMSP